MEGTTGAGGASPVNGGRDDNRVASAKRWVPPSIVRRDALTQENKQDIIFRRVRGILNKLTPEKFDKLSSDLLKEELNSRTILNGVIYLVFDKALDEPKYSSMYAQLCRKLCEAVAGPNGKEPCQFRLLLLNSCRTQFENRANHSSDKRKSLGNIKFVGELCKLDMVHVAIIYGCVFQLLKKSEAMAENFECLCQILRTCGQKLDSEMAQKRMDQYFSRMEKFAESPELPIRIRFMLRDTIELRKNDWKPRKASHTEGPQPMNQICDDGGTNMRAPNDRPPQQELFPRQFKPRHGLDLLPGGLSFPQHDKFPAFNSNGYQSYAPGNNARDRVPQRQSAFHHGGGGPQNNHFYQQNRYNSNQHNNNNSNNMPSNKDLAPRFIKNIVNSHDSVSNVDQVSLRPPAHSMHFKTPNAKPLSTPLFPGRTGTLAPSLKPQNSPPIQTAKEVPILIKQASADKVKPTKKDKAATKEETLKKAASLAEEVIAGGNIDDAASNFLQMKAQDRLIPECISAVLSLTNDKTVEQKESVMEFLTALHKNGAMTPSHFHDAFRSLVKALPDCDSEADVPETYGNAACLASSAIQEDYLTISQLGELTEDGVNMPLFFLSLAELKKKLGKEKLNELFTESKVNLMNILKKSERNKSRLNQVLEGRDLVFLEPLLVLERELWAALEREPTKLSLYKAAQSIASEHNKSPAFITALVTVTLKYVTQETTLSMDVASSDSKALLEKERALLCERFIPVLSHFLSEDTTLQVIAVYALQVFFYGYDFPKGMLLRWFKYFYEFDAVEEEAFLRWKEEDVTDIFPGKGKALFQVNQWLTSLAEAESEEEEDDDGDN